MEKNITCKGQQKKVKQQSKDDISVHKQRIKVGGNSKLEHSVSNVKDGALRGNKRVKAKNK